jgi:hypothetical protein
MTPPTILPCDGNVFTETDPQRHAANNSSIVTYIRCRGNVFTEPLPGNERRDTLYRVFT